jgi:oxygen-independent coproporphyrinogen-3 oxidase
MSSLRVDLDLVQKYNVAGPRYTSYPPATMFTPSLDWSKLAERILANNQGERDLSLYFHIPFCETLCWYCGCTTVITGNHARGRAYVGDLEKEVAQMKTLMNPRRKVAQLHWGGGSPTFLQPEEIRALGRMIQWNFALADDVEAGVEIDPRRLTRDHLAALREAGFNRASIGVQDFDADVQEAIHRVQPRELTERAVNWARELGFRSINFDLIYGLPCQTVESFDRTLDAVLELKPDRVAAFSYAHVPWLKPAQKILERKTLPTPEIKLQLFKRVI